MESGERASPTIKVAITGENDEKQEDRSPSFDTLVVGRYRLGRRIGKGGMGEVMAARDEQVGRDVAIKRMRAANPSERAIARFLREASVQGRLEHPAIVPVHQIGRDDDNLPFFVMKKVQGTALAALVSYRARARHRPSRSQARQRHARRFRRGLHPRLGRREDRRRAGRLQRCR